MRKSDNTSLTSSKRQEGQSKNTSLTSSELYAKYLLSIYQSNQGEANPICFSQEEESICLSQEEKEKEPICLSQKESTHLSQEEQDPIYLSQKEESTHVSQEEQDPIYLSQEEDSTLVSQEEQDPIHSSQEEPVCPFQEDEEKESICSSHKDEDVSFPDIFDLDEEEHLVIKKHTYGFLDHVMIVVFIFIVMRVILPCFQRGI